MSRVVVAICLTTLRATWPLVFALQLVLLTKTQTHIQTVLSRMRLTFVRRRGHIDKDSGDSLIMSWHSVAICNLAATRVKGKLNAEC